MDLAEAKTVRLIFGQYLKLGSVRLLKEDLDRRGVLSKVRVSKNGVRSGGCRFSRGALYELLANPIYIGEIRHKQLRHPGQHEPIIDRKTWKRVQELLGSQAVRKERPSTKSSASLLAGKIFDETGEPLYACGASSRGRRYHYYVSRKLIRNPTQRPAVKAHFMEPMLCLGVDKLREGSARRYEVGLMKGASLELSFDASGPR